VGGWILTAPLPDHARRCDDLERQLAKAQQAAGSGQAAAQGPTSAAASPRKQLPGEHEMLLAVRAAEERAAAADAVALDAQAHSEVGGCLQQQPQSCLLYRRKKVALRIPATLPVAPDQVLYRCTAGLPEDAREAGGRERRPG
jgi:hypothetical protein